MYHRFEFVSHVDIDVLVIVPRSNQTIEAQWSDSCTICVLVGTFFDSSYGLYAQLDAHSLVGNLAAHLPPPDDYDTYN